MRRSGTMAWIAAACVSFGCGCSDGTSRWILKQQAARDGAVSDHDAATGNDGGLIDDAAIAPRSRAGALLGNPADFVSVCSPQVSVDNLTANGRGALFDKTFADPTTLVVETAHRVCATLYKNAGEAPRSPPVELVIDDFYGIGEISITAPVIYIRLSSLRMQSTADAGQ